MSANSVSTIHGWPRRQTPGKPPHAHGLLALALLERQVEGGERLFVLRYPPLPQRAQPARGTPELGGQLRFGPLGDRVARGGARGFEQARASSTAAELPPSAETAGGSGTSIASARGIRAPMKFSQDTSTEARS